MIAVITPLDWPYLSKRMEIGQYSFELPPWWHDVSVPTLDELDSEKETAAYVRENFGADVGTPDNWQEALKVWAICESRSGSFPVYIGHCYRTGGEYRNAIRVYSDLYELADSQGEDRDWYQCYLAHNVGFLMLEIDEPEKAQSWLGKSAAFSGHKDNAIAYYADLAKKELDLLSQK